MSSTPFRLRPLFLAAGLAFAGAALPAQDGDLAERLFRSGERAYAAHAYPEAVDTWNQLIVQAPKSDYAAQALLSLAHYQLDVLKQPEAALPPLERVRNEYLRSPWAAEALLLRGEILAARARDPQELKAALAEYDRVVDLFPGHRRVQQARFLMGAAHRRLGQWGRALEDFTEAMRLDPGNDLARDAQLQAAELLDLMDDLPGCLRMLQSLRNLAPGSEQAREADWRIRVRVKLRLQKPPLRSLGPWPEGRQKWLKTPTLLALGPTGELALYQDDLDQAFRLKDGQLSPAGAPVKDARGMVVTPGGQVWLVNARQGVVREAAADAAPGAAAQPPVANPAGAALDAWGNLWVGDPKLQAIQVLPPEGAPHPIPAPGVVALASLPTGGVAAASDASRALLFLDAQGRTLRSLPYGKDLPAPFKYVVALASDPLGHLAALVDGDFEGIVLWGPDGSVLRSATYKSLGLSGKFRALALDRQGCLILADRSNDLLIRIE
jgi:tetratricopeptide (TPR) repeat protein